MKINPSVLRKNIYKVLDHILETGEPVEIERKGSILKIIPDDKKGRKLSRLTPRDCIAGDPEDLVHCDWSNEWSEETE